MPIALGARRDHPRPTGQQPYAKPAISLLVNSVRSEARRWLMLGSSACAGRSPTAASAIAVAIRIPTIESFRRRKNMRYSLPVGLRLAQFRLQAPYRRPPIYAGLHRISGSKDRSYYRDFRAIERLLRSPRWQPNSSSLAPPAARELSIGTRHALQAAFLESSSR